MSGDRPLYDTLGVSPTASAAEVRKAWLELARQLHPDMNPGNAAVAGRFRAVRAAWDVLGDPARRALYDEFGEDATSAFFDPEAARSRPKGRTWAEDAVTDTVKQYRVTKGEDYRAALHLTAAEARKGGLIELYVRPPMRCGSCNGTGWRPSQRACGRCEAGVLPGIGPWGVPVPAGVIEGQVLVARGEGAKGRGQGAPPGDLWMICRVEPEFKAQGADQVVEVPLDPNALDEGGKLRVPLPDGGAVRMTVPPHSRVGQQLRLRGKAAAGGDLYVKFVATRAVTEVRPHRILTA